MQATTRTTRDAPARNAIARDAQQRRKLHSVGNRFRAVTPLNIVSSPLRDDCTVSDKLPKQIDDLIEGESPKSFRRLKTSSDIVAR